jgi:hypothetical protein
MCSWKVRVRASLFCFTVPTQKSATKHTRPVFHLFWNPTNPNGHQALTASRENVNNKTQQAGQLIDCCCAIGSFMLQHLAKSILVSGWKRLINSLSLFWYGRYEL